MVNRGLYGKRTDCKQHIDEVIDDNFYIPTKGYFFAN